jgi:hypothetical protein
MKTFSLEICDRDNFRMQNLFLWIQFWHKFAYAVNPQTIFLHAPPRKHGVLVLHHRVFGIPTKHLVVRRPELSWIVRDRLHPSAALAAASRGTPMAMRRLRMRRPSAATLVAYDIDNNSPVATCRLQCAAGKCCGLNGFRITHRDLWLKSGAAIPLQL